MYKSVIFDLDGTLLDTTSGVVYAVKYTIDELGLPMPGKDIIASFVGPPMQNSFEKHFEMNKNEALKAANLFRKNYKEHSLFKAELYPDVLECMKKLRDCGYKIAVATNKSHDNAMEILSHFGAADYCDYMMGSDLEGRLKKADIILSCLKELNTSPEESVYVGDSIFDLEGAKTVGMDFIGVTYGFGFRENNDYEFTTISRIDMLEEILC